LLLLDEILTFCGTGSRPDLGGALAEVFFEKFVTARKVLVSSQPHYGKH